MKYRLVIDNDANTSKPWYVVQKWEELISPETGRVLVPGYWDRVDSGFEEHARKVYQRLIDGKPRFTIVETEEQETKSMFKAREAKADLSV